MNEFQTSKKYIDFTLRNFEADTLKIVNYERDISQTIVNNMSEYDLSIVRFKLPASAIKKYFVEKGSGDHIMYMMWDRFITSLDMTADNKIECYTPKAFLDYINPALRKLYGSFYLNTISAGEDVPGSDNEKKGTYTGSFTFEHSNIDVLSHTFQILPQDTGYPANKATYMKFKINSITPEYITEINQMSSSIPMNMNLSLAVGGKECLLLNSPNFDNLGQFSNVVLEDGSGNHNQSHFSANKNRQPYEPLHKLNQYANSDEDYTIKFECTEAFFKYTINFTVDVYYVLPPEQSTYLLGTLLTEPPFFSYDSADNFIFNYSPSWFRSGIKLGFSDTLRNAFDFFEYFQINNVYYLALPQQEVGESTDNTLKITQLQSSMYKFNMVHSIELISNLPVENELVITTLTDNSSNDNLITDFLPDPSGLADHYIYNANNDYRRYRMDGNQLRKLSIRARVVYSNGIKEDVRLKNGEICNIKVELIPINGLY
jgi:hypothetical protein